MKRHLFTAAVICLMLPAIAGATYLPYNIDTIESYMDSAYFGAYHEVFSLNFEGLWNYTAVAHESGNWNMTEEAVDGLSFTTEDYSNWGLWESIDFDTDNLFFSDSNGPADQALDPFSSPALFRVFQLDDATTLSYLDNPVSLSVGALVIGFNDNGDPSDGDSDFDDLIIAAQAAPAPVPEPSTILLLGSGLIGLAWYGRKRNKA